MTPARSTTARTTTTTALVLATAGGLLGAATATATAATTCTSPVFKRQFFANTTFSGTPKKTDCDSVVNQNWGTGAPAAGLPANRFGVRWTVTRDFGSGGPFTFTVSAQDGVRVYLDGKLKIDLWKNVSSTVSRTVHLTIPENKHSLRVDYVNWTGTANVEFTCTPRTSATVDKVEPKAPTGTSVAHDAATGRAKVSWAKNKEMDLAGYRVYRRPAGGAWTRLATTTSTSYTDTTLPATGASYAYRVRAHDKAGNLSDPGAKKTVATTDRTAPAAPATPTTASEPAGLWIGWTPVPDAASYRVYRAASQTGAYTAVGSASGDSFVDTTAEEGVTHYYRVTAVDAAGNESDTSAAVSGRRRDLTPPSAVTGLTATPTTYGFRLEWDANPTPDLHRYVVHAGDVITEDGERYCDAWEAEWLSADTTTVDLGGRPDGEERCFFVDAVDDAWNSHYEWTHEPTIVAATELDTTPSVPTPAGAPLTVTARGVGGVEIDERGEGNEIRWERSAEAPPAHYRVHRWNPETSAYERIAEVSGDTLSHFDGTAPRGTTSYYWVTAVGHDGAESLPAGDYAILLP
jgi:fibronectin type 3 domain-containing protein